MVIDLRINAKTIHTQNKKINLKGSYLCSKTTPFLSCCGLRVAGVWFGGEPLKKICSEE